MTLNIVSTSFSAPRNTHKNMFNSVENSISPNWRVNNLVPRPAVILQDDNSNSLPNISGVYYNEFNQRVGFLQNNTRIVYEYTLESILNGTPSFIRQFEITAMAGNDSEGVGNVVPNYLEGGFEQFYTEESGSANRGYIVDVTSLLSSSVDTTQAVRQRFNTADAAGSNNSGSEDGDIDEEDQYIVQVQEGEQVGTVPQVYAFTRPTDRDTTPLDGSLFTGGNNDFVVTTPVNIASIFPSGVDLSGCCYHKGADTWIFLSHLLNQAYQVSIDKVAPHSGTALIATLNFTANQAEGACVVPDPNGGGDKLIISSEPGSSSDSTYIVCDYVEP